MSTSATSPSNDPAGLFAVNNKLVPIISTLFGVIVVGTIGMCILGCIHRRKLQRLANDPVHIAMRMERDRVKKEFEKGPETPKMRTVNLEIDLEVGEPGQGTGRGREWRTLAPLSLELSPGHPAPPPPYQGKAKAEGAAASTPSEGEEAKYVRLVVLVALPSESGRRLHHKDDDVILEATLADAQGRPIQSVDALQQDYHGLPETTFGVYQEKYVGAL